jgi:hypothetical protein
MVPRWLRRPMWDESRALPAFDPARFAFAIREVAVPGRWRLRRVGGARRATGLHCIDNCKLAGYRGIAVLAINSGGLPRTEMPGLSRGGPLRSC